MTDALASYVAAFARRNGVEPIDLRDTKLKRYARLRHKAAKQLHAAGVGYMRITEALGYEDSATVRKIVEP